MRCADRCKVIFTAAEKGVAREHCRVENSRDDKPLRGLPRKDKDLDEGIKGVLIFDA